MQLHSKVAAVGLIICLVLTSACRADVNPEDDIEEHAPFIPEYGLLDFQNYMGNYYPEFDVSIDYHDNIDGLFAQYFDIMIALDPQLIDTRRFPEEIVPSRPDKLTPVSFGYKAWQIQLAKNTLEVLKQYSDAGLTQEQQINKDILSWALELMVDGEKFLYHDVLCLNNLVVISVFMQLTHEINTGQDAENYLARLKYYPEVLNQMTTNLKIQEEIGYVPPLVVLDTAVQRINFYEGRNLHDFSERVEHLAEKDLLISRCEQILDELVNPAFRELKRQIAKMRVQSVNNVGELPGGKDYYAWLLRSYTTTDMTPKEVYILCKDEVDRLQKEIKRVLDSLGYDSSDYVKIISGLSEDIIAEEQVIPTYEGLIRQAEGLLPELFGKLPNTPVEVHPNRVRVGYDLPTRDGRPGVFLAIPAMHNPKIGAKWLVWHESIPGHHMQCAMESEADVPYFRDLLFLDGSLEGWATYGEMLFFEFELVDDPASYLSSLNRYLMLSARVVMDVGINYLEWSKEEADQYFSGVTGLQSSQWIDDVISRPGRSAAYYVGMAKIRELREMAKSELGAAFEIRDFHDLILQYGSLPLDVMTDLVIDYVEAKK